MTRIYKNLPGLKSDDDAPQQRASFGRRETPNARTARSFSTGQLAALLCFIAAAAYIVAELVDVI